MKCTLKYPYLLLSKNKIHFHENENGQMKKWAYQTFFLFQLNIH